ncbi:vitamin K epoxide reductase family protein [Thermodesulfovibrio hydrogeniphilus]
MKIQLSSKLSYVSSFLYLLGLLFSLTELILHFYNKSLCKTEGCRIVESFVRGGDIVLLLIGILLFSVLFYLSIKQKFPYIHSALLIISLATEGYLLGFQSFIIKEFCVFCLTIFTILFISAVLRLIQGRRELAFAFLSFVSVFFITYFVNPQINEMPSAQYVLLYSKDCPHCKEVIQLCTQMSIPVHAVDVKEVSGILKSLKINSVPVLYCNQGTEKKFIVGADSIKQYLFANAVKIQQAEGVCPIFSSSEECK